MKSLKNTYYLLRHGRNIHQTELKDVCYGWPDDKIPCALDEVGLKEVTASGMKLKECQIDLIYSSDILRAKQTAEVVAALLGIEEVHFNVKLRDLNWGVFAGGLKQNYKDFYQDKNKMIDRPENGESWGDLQKRVSEFLEELEEKQQDKNILLVSHGDALLLLEAWFHDWNLSQIEEERKNMIRTGELKKLN